MTKKKKIIIIFFITLLVILAYFGFSLASKLLKVFGSADPVNNITPVSDELILEQSDSFSEIKNPDQNLGNNDFSNVVSGIVIDKELLNKKRGPLFVEEEKNNEISTSTTVKTEKKEMIATSSLEKEDGDVVGNKADGSTFIDNKVEDVITNNETSASSSNPDLNELPTAVIDESTSSGEVLE